MTRLQRMLERLPKAYRQTHQVDPSRFDHPLAQRVSWKPNSGSGATVSGVRLVAASPGRLELRPTRGMRVMLVVFLLAGPLGVAAGVHLGQPLFVFIGVVFGAAGAFGWSSRSRPLVFDQRCGLFYEGRAPPVDGRSARKRIHLADVAALQIVSMQHWDPDSYTSRQEYTSHELNLVLGDLSRTTVEECGSLPTLRADARRIAGFLGVQIWDGGAE